MMYIQENLTTTPHEVPGVSWALPAALEAKFWKYNPFARLVLDEDRTGLLDIIDDQERRQAFEARAAREQAERAAREAARRERQAEAALEARGAAAMARIMFRAQAPAMGADDIIRCRALAERWAPGVYQAGDVRTEDSVPYRCCQAHDSTGNPDWKPGTAYALWAAYHGTSPETALPWAAPTGAHDLYRAGECMKWTDGGIRQAVRDTNFSPEEDPAAWMEA